MILFVCLIIAEFFRILKMLFTVTLLSLNHSFTMSFIDQSVHSPIHSFIHTFSFIYSLTPFIHSLTPFIHSHIFIHLFTHSIYSFIHFRFVQAKSTRGATTTKGSWATVRRRRFLVRASSPPCRARRSTRSPAGRPTLLPGPRRNRYLPANFRPPCPWNTTS